MIGLLERDVHMAIKDLEELTREQLKSVADQFGSTVHLNMNKPTMLKILREDGINAQLYNTVMSEVESEKQDELSELEPDVKTETVTESYDEEELMLIKMVRPNHSYEVRGYRFTKHHPYVAVKEDDADYLVETVGGFRPASPRELRDFYGA